MKNDFFAPRIHNPTRALTNTQTREQFAAAALHLTAALKELRAISGNTANVWSEDALHWMQEIAEIHSTENGQAGIVSAINMLTERISEGNK
jgi:hypothetical protein